MKRIRRTNEDWMNIIRECKCSGLSDQIWLRENHIPASSYYKKYHELCGVIEENTPLPEKHLSEVPETHEIVQVSFGEESNSLSVSHVRPEPAVILKAGTYTLEILNTAGAETIRNTLAALRQLC